MTARLIGILVIQIVASALPVRDARAVALPPELGVEATYSCSGPHKEMRVAVVARGTKDFWVQTLYFGDGKKFLYSSLARKQHWQVPLRMEYESHELAESLYRIEISGDTSAFQHDKIGSVYSGVWRLYSPFTQRTVDRKVRLEVSRRKKSESPIDKKTIEIFELLQTGEEKEGWSERSVMQYSPDLRMSISGETTRTKDGKTTKTRCALKSISKIEI